MNRYIWVDIIYEDIINNEISYIIYIYIILIIIRDIRDIYE